MCHLGKRCTQFIYFLTRLESFMPFSTNLNMFSAKSFNSEESNICRLGKGLTKRQLIGLSLTGTDDVAEVRP